MKYLVTGGAGMIGSALSRHLLAQGHEVIIVDDLSRGSTTNVPEGARLHRLDVATEEFLDLVGSLAPLAGILHLAAVIGGVGRMIESPFDSHVNAVIDAFALRAAVRTGTPLLYCSTACVYPVQHQTHERSGEPLREEMAEDPGANPESLYGWIKLLGEKACAACTQQTGVPTKIVRMFNVYGPGEISARESAHVVPALIMKANTEEDLQVWGDGKQERSFLFTEDAACGILRVFERGEPAQPYNLGQPNRTTIGELAREILALCDPSKKIVFDTTRPTGVFTRMPEIARARALGWQPGVSLSEGLRRTVEWMSCSAS